MSPLFRKSADKRAQKAAAQTEIDRLKALDVADLAAELLPALGRDGVGGGHSVRPQQLCDYLLRDALRPRQLKALELMAPVSRALDLLENAGLASPIWHQRTPVWRITPRGESTLAEGTIRQQLE
ncbi:MAG: hypothetical protein WAL63_04735 [Solirubrobacteraceae bacterium]